MPGVKTVAIVAALVALTGCAASAAAAPRDEPTDSPTPIATAVPVVHVSATAMRGHGELAFVSAHQLYLLDASGVRRVPLEGHAIRPIWSNDGRWMAVVTSPAPPKSNPYADEPTSVWLVSSAGKIVRRLTPNGVHDAVAQWSPTADRLAITYQDHGADHAELVGTGGKVTHLVNAYDISGLAWSPAGTRLAVGLNSFAKAPGSWTSRIVTIAARGAARRTVTTEKGNVLDVAGWWPDGSGVLAWLDYQGSGSLAADGLPLLDVSVATGRRRQLAKSMLQYPQWLATSKRADKVAFIAGGDRELTLGHKHVEICGKQRCHKVKQSSTRVSFDPAWSASGRLAFIRDKAISASHGFGMSYVDKTQASGGLALLVPFPRSHVGRLSSGASASDPVWGRGGDGSMLVVRDHALWLLTSALNKATRVAGPLQAPSNYYGFVPWQDSFAWSAAAG